MTKLAAQCCICLVRCVCFKLSQQGQGTDLTDGLQLPEKATQLLSNRHLRPEKLVFHSQSIALTLLHRNRERNTPQAAKSLPCISEGKEGTVNSSN
eukprot:458237-Pelagomonas_calceolata.AAC.6